MAVNLILSGLSVLSVAYALKCRYNKDKAVRRNESVEKELAYLRRENNHQETMIKNTANKLSEMENLAICGHKNLRIREMFVTDDNGLIKQSVSVIGVDQKRPSLFFVIKHFIYNPQDTEDYDFARIEANELIEKLEE